MADRVTQLQDCLDQLATQFYASIRYLTSHHAKPPLPPAPSTNTATTANNHAPATNTTSAAAPLVDPDPDPEMPKTPPPDSPATFAAAQHELAADLLLKVAQIEFLIGVLPGVENSAVEQEARIRELEALKDVERERARAVAELNTWRDRVDGVIVGVRRGTA